MTLKTGKFWGTRGGFTLVEVLVTLGLVVIFLPVAGAILTNSQMAASLSKHKTEATYAAQQIIEAQRQDPFVVLSSGHTQVTGPSWVILDTKGNYNNSNTGVCSTYNTNNTVFCGQAVVTITPAVYTSTSGTKTTSTTVDHVAVQIYWNENRFIHPSVTYATDIANDPMLN
ncbi:MAG: type II secretion system protein [Candidatus Omnitrophica bacterium]|nr:type II secretion system protein [Candidatus Omnitrophota bacterium]